MKTLVCLCTCSGTLPEKLDIRAISTALGKLPDLDSLLTVPSLCTEEGHLLLVQELRDRKPDRIVFAACSPRNHEQALRRILVASGINPHLMQIANIREQVAWVTPDRAAATRKAITLIRAAIASVRYHEPLEKQKIPVCTDVMVVGAGPAGLSAAQVLAQSGRNVILVEKSPSPGGMPLMFDEIFPDRTCAPCMMQPILDGILHGEYPGRTELLTLSQVRSVRGAFGHYEVSIAQSPRFIDTVQCIGCGECVNVCPATVRSSDGIGMGKRKAVDFASPGALPHVPHIDAASCLRAKGKTCNACLAACPVDGAIRFGDRLQLHERTVGAVILATGGAIFDHSEIPMLEQGSRSDVIASPSFERMLSNDGPSKGMIRTSSRRSPAGIAIVHCVGSLDEEYQPYCSAVCCRYALKYRAAIRERLPEAKIVHLMREWCLPGQKGQSLYRAALNDRGTKVLRYRSLSSMSIAPSGKEKKISFEDASGKRHQMTVDMIILCPAIVPREETPALARMLGLTTDEFGFFSEARATASTAAKGLVTAGVCAGPVDIKTAMEQGRAAAGRIIADLPVGAELEVLPARVQVDPARCSGCMLCVGLCPEQAIEPASDRAGVSVRDLLCSGCGVCIASCPARALHGSESSSAALSAELKGTLENSKE